MKYLIILGDGMADEPVAELGGRTPLQAARTPAMDRVAASGASGLLDTVPEGFHPGIRGGGIAAGSGALGQGYDFHARVAIGGQ